MSVKVKCHSGKCEQTFNNLKPGDIEVYDCGECPKEEAPEKEAEAPMEMTQAKPEETRAERKAREKAEKKAKEDAEKQKAE